MPSAVAKGVALLVLFGGVSPAAGQNNVFANRAALLVARNSSSSSADSTVLGPHEQQQHAGSSHGRDLRADTLVGYLASHRFVVRLLRGLGLVGHEPRLQPGLLELQQRY